MRIFPTNTGLEDFIMVNIEICGDYVAVALSYEDDDGDRVRLFVINWKSGFKFSVSELSKLLLAGHS